MNRKQLIESLLQAKFENGQITVADESHMHSRGQESHYHVVVISEQFSGKRKVARHQLVQGCLAELFSQGLHALTITAVTKDEWDQNPNATVSPGCSSTHKS
jgi:BolA protein